MDASTSKALCWELLPAGLVMKDVVTGQGGNPMHDYEGWLRELINCSEAFLRKTGGEPFHAPVEEAHGEADAITERYSIDFKLVAGRSMLRALRETSPQKVVVGGSTFTSKGRKICGLAGIKLHACLGTATRRTYAGSGGQAGVRASSKITTHKARQDSNHAESARF